MKRPAGNLNTSWRNRLLQLQGNTASSASMGGLEGGGHKQKSLVRARGPEGLQEGVQAELCEGRAG